MYSASSNYYDCSHIEPRNKLVRRVLSGLKSGLNTT